MKTWSVVYVRIPTNFHDQQSAIVEAETEQDARDLVRRQLGDDRVKLPNYHIVSTTEYVPKAIKGRIVTMNGGK